MNTLTAHPHVVLSIAGSDPSGGAGIQADIKTISALGGYAAAAITAITAQNTLGVQGIFPVQPEVLRAQLTSVMDDLHPTAVKIGMVHDAEQVAVIADILQRYVPPFVVYDPVMVSTSGRRLMTEETVACIEQNLFPLCTLITPNLDEASLLMYCLLHTPEEMTSAGRTLSSRYGCHVLVKGGHLDGEEMCDILCTQSESTTFRAPRTHSNNLHGTGCTLSSAIATRLSQGYSLHTAVASAKEYVSRAIQQGSTLRIGQGNGPLWHFGFTPHTEQESEPMPERGR